MTDIPENVDDSFERLTDMAAEQDVEVDPGFLEGIGNYLLIEKVRDLSEVQKAVVALRIGEEAISYRINLPGRNLAVRQDAENVILQLCGDPFGRCHGTALEILGALDDPGDLSPLMD
jgi:hypothetical protein